MLVQNFRAPQVAAEYQWSVEVPFVVSSETQAAPRAFLWIPPDCTRLRGVVLGQHNMEEEAIFENPKFRKALADLNFAVVWVTPGWNLFFRFDRGAGKGFDDLMGALATESGYEELSSVPAVPLGNSAAASFPWNFAAWAPERTLAVISVSGQWPYYVDSNTPDWGNRNVDGIPGLVSMGEYEAAESRAAMGLEERATHPKTALSMLSTPGEGHFDPSEDKIEYLAFYLKKAAEYRLPPSDAKGPVKLIPGPWIFTEWVQTTYPSGQRHG